MDYEQKMERHILPTLGHCRLRELTRGTLKPWLLDLEKKHLSHTTIKHIVTPLSAMLGSAVDEDRIPSNPAFHLSRIFKLKKIQKPQSKAFQREETKRIFEHCRKQFPHWCPLVATLFWSGIRFGEAAALERHDVNFQGTCLIISKNFTAGHLETTTKSGAVRHVPMPQPLQRILQRHIKTLDSLAGSPKTRSSRSLVFPGPTGIYLNHSGFIHRVWRPLLQKAAVEYRPPHSTRHTFVTRLLEADVSLSKIQKLVGHSTIRLTVDTYGHLMTDDVRKAIELLTEKG